MSNPWDRQEDETARAFVAFSDYLAMGAGRSLEKLLDRYRSANESSSISVKPPTLRMKTLADWSRHNNWQARVRMYEESAAASKVLTLEEQRAKVLADELEDYERLRAAYLREMQALPLHHTAYEDTQTSEEATEDGGKVTTLTVTRYKRLDTIDLYRLSRTRLALSKLARLATGMPDQMVDVTSAGQAVKGYTVLAHPGMWDEDENDGDSDSI